MASHFRWYGSDSDVTVPFNARYSYPSQANKAVKSVPRIPPKNQNTFQPGSEIRIEIPAQGYINPGNTTLEFDVTLKYTPIDSQDHSIIRFQNNIQSIFNRMRIMYGSTPLEDVPEYGLLVRCLTEWTATGQSGAMDQMSIGDGVGKAAWGTTGAYPAGSAVTYVDSVRPAMVNARQAYIHGISLQEHDLKFPAAFGGEDDKILNAGLNGGNGWGCVPHSNSVFPTITPNVELLVTRRYQVQIHAGLMQQGKLIPAKYMASQLAIQLTLEPAANCIFWQKGIKHVSGPAWEEVLAKPPTYEVSNVHLIPEILEFDSRYDETFLQGLMDGGVPIKFASWHNFSFASPAANNMTFSIPERNRSIKAVFVVQTRDPKLITTDSGTTFFDTNTGAAGSTLQEYQYRIGGRMFPASPVQCSDTVGGSKSNGGCEAYVELSKAINVIGDYRLSTSSNTLTWASSKGILPDVADYSTRTLLPEFDGKYSVTTFKPDGVAFLWESESSRKNISGTPKTTSFEGRSYAGNQNSCCFVMAVDLETSNGLEISGLNAEEQSDISINIRYSASQATGMIFQAFTYFDAMIVLKENNVVELII